MVRNVRGKSSAEAVTAAAIATRPQTKVGLIIANLSVKRLGIDCMRFHSVSNTHSEQKRGRVYSVGTTSARWLPLPATDVRGEGWGEGFE
jgi:hypothetical protein